MLRRKLIEIGSILYRHLLYPFKRAVIEKRTNSIMKQGSYLFDGTTLGGKNYIGQKAVLKHCSVGEGSVVQKDCDLSFTEIGKYCSIGMNVSSVLGKHPANTIVAIHPAFYSTHGNMAYSYAKKDYFLEQEYVDKTRNVMISIGNDVWIGNNVSVLGGVTIGDGAIIASGAVVNKNVVPYGIYGGVPAKLIHKRFTDEQIEKLLKLKWWEKDEEWIRSHIDYYEDIDKFLEAVKAELNE